MPRDGPSACRAHSELAPSAREAKFPTQTQGPLDTGAQGSGW